MCIFVFKFKKERQKKSIWTNTLSHACDGGVKSIFVLRVNLSNVCVYVCVFKLNTLTCRLCEGCIRSEQGTPARLWSGAHAGRGTASRAAAPGTDSSEASPERGRCLSSTGLRDKR